MHPTLTPSAPSADGHAPEFLRVKEACRVFGLSRSGLYRLAAAGEVRLVKLGAATLVDAGSVRRFMAGLPSTL